MDKSYERDTEHYESLKKSKDFFLVWNIRDNSPEEEPLESGAYVRAI